MLKLPIIIFGFCDIQNNQGLGKGYQPQPSADNPCLDLDYSGWRFQPSHFGLKTPVQLENISGLPFSLNILLVFETLPSQRKTMFSSFNQSS